MGVHHKPMVMEMVASSYKEDEDIVWPIWKHIDVVSPLA